MGIAFVAIWFGRCSMHKPQPPPELGDCVPAPGVTCANAKTMGGGSASAPADSGAVGAGDAASAGVGCGTVDSLLAATSPTCLSCVMASSDCCLADQACSGTCQSLLECTKQCAQGDQVCLGGCENTWPTGLHPYQALAQCLSQNCSGQCPALQQ